MAAAHHGDVWRGRKAAVHSGTRHRHDGVFLVAVRFRDLQRSPEGLSFMAQGLWFRVGGALLPPAGQQELVGSHCLRQPSAQHAQGVWGGIS